MQVAQFRCGNVAFAFSPPIQLGGHEAPRTLARLVAIAVAGASASDEAINLSEDQVRPLSLDTASLAMQLIMLRELLAGKHTVHIG